MSARAKRLPRTLVDDEGRVVCGRCEVASTMFARMRGLIGRDALAPDEGLLIPRSGSIHMFFMRFPIDAVFLDRGLRVLKISRNLQRNRLAAALGARNVLELPAGAADRAGLEVGARLTWHDQES